MAIQLEGSCHCGAVTFRVDSETPYPFNLCYCSICRKTNGGGGYAINIMGLNNTLEVWGEENLSTYQAVKNGERSPCQRRFCKLCGTHLWLYDPRWSAWVYPLASAIDTDLPEAPDRVHLMLGSKASWVTVPGPGPLDVHFTGYPDGSIQKWHEDRGLLQA
jgi:hypothetical protein